MNGRLKRNEKYMAVVLRFLKESNMLTFWKEYVQKEIKSNGRFIDYHWSNVPYIDNVLGKTNFTSFITDKLKERDGIYYHEGACMYIRFAYWLKEMGLLKDFKLERDAENYIKNVSGQEIARHIEIDPITRKTKIIFHIFKF